MPIYAYKCESCGHQQDILQKVSDPLLTTCPACGQASFVKQITAAGFQLKGSGWYATDFRNNGSPPSAKDTKDAQKDSAPAAGKPGPSDDSAAGPAADKPAPATPPTGGSSPTTAS